MRRGRLLRGQRIGSVKQRVDRVELAVRVTKAPVAVARRSALEQRIRAAFLSAPQALTFHRSREASDLGADEAAVDADTAHGREQLVRGKFRARVFLLAHRAADHGDQPIDTRRQIGGEDARLYLLNLLEQTEDEDAVEFLEDAIENLDFNEELNSFDLMSLDEDEDEVDYDEEDLDDEDEK